MSDQGSPFTEADLEDICLGDLDFAAGSMQVEDVASDLDRKAVEHGLRVASARGYVVLADALATLTPAGRARHDRDRSARIKWSTDGPG
jgi:hypothetical protein